MTSFLILCKRMRAVALVGVLLVTVSLAIGGEKPADKIIGEWKGTDSTGATASVVFAADHTFRMVMGNVLLDGAALGGKIEWRIDATKDPIPLDVIVTEASGEKRVLLMIVRFLTDRTLRFCVSPDMETRPTDFAAADGPNQMVVTKQ